MQSIKKLDCQLIKSSSLYETEAWGMHQQPSFLNQVIEIKTTVEPQKLIEQLLQIEANLGRTRTNVNQSRTIDIDILFYEDIVLNTKNLTLPHPRLHLRNFTLQPLNEIAPNLNHPILNKTCQQLLTQCPDTLQAVKIQ